MLRWQLGGRLEGRVINASGKPITNTAVTVQYHGSEVAQTVTDEGGRYAVNGLQGGVHQVVAGGESAAYRLWTDKTAPPAAKQDAVLVSYGAAPATSGWGDCGAWLRNPWVIGALVATAIAVPVAIEAADDDDNPPAS